MATAPSDGGVRRRKTGLALFDRCIRWILGDRSKPRGAARYAFFTCHQAQAAAAGGVRPGKQNDRCVQSSGDFSASPELIFQSRVDQLGPCEPIMLKRRDPQVMLVDAYPRRACQ